MAGEVGGGVLIYDAGADYWLLFGCESAGWCDAWGHSAVVDESRAEGN